MTIQGGSAAAPSLTFSGDTNTGIFSPAADTIAFSEGGVESMRIDASGNVGFGVVPSAWNVSGYSALQIRTGSILAGTDDTNFTTNAYYTSSGGGWVRLNTAGISRYQQYGGNHVWHNAAAGTAGTSFSFTQAMTLDASGNLLVGTTTNAGRVTIYGADSGAVNFALRVRSSGGTDGLIVRNDPYVGVPNNYNITTGSAANMYFGADGFIYRSTSSQRYKTNIRDYDKGLDAVKALRPVYYQSNKPDVDGNIPETQYAGLIAEEVDSAGLQEFVVYNDENVPEALHYGNMVSLCIKAIQELKAELDATKAEVALLKGAA
jgi:hypothetical protein